MNARQRVDDLITIGGRLADLLAKENDALRSRESKGVSALVDDKLMITRIYESRVKGMIESPEDLTKVEGDLRDRLRLLGTKIRDLMEENAQLLRVAIEAHRRVAEVIAEAVKASQPGLRTYSAAGARGRPSKPQTIPLTVNRAL